MVLKNSKILSGRGLVFLARPVEYQLVFSVEADSRKMSPRGQDIVRPPKLSSYSETWEAATAVIPTQA